jgi:hypothetical protein
VGLEENETDANRYVKAQTFFGEDTKAEKLTSAAA